MLFFRGLEHGFADGVKVFFGEIGVLHEIVVDVLIVFADIVQLDFKP